MNKEKRGSNLIHGTHAGDGTNVVCDCNKSSPGQILFADAIASVLAHHMAKTKRTKRAFLSTSAQEHAEKQSPLRGRRSVPGCYSGALKAEALVISAINVLNQLVDVSAIALGRHL